MKASRKLRRVLTIAAMLLATLVTAIPAYAEPPGGGSGTDGGGGNNGGGNFEAWVKYHVQLSGSGYDGHPNVPATDYDPPDCWYQPQYTYGEMMEWAREIR